MDLTIISFVIAVIGIILQLSNAFPEHREIRQVIFYMSIGMFVGVVASGMLGAQYKITGNVDRQFALLYGLAAMCAIFGAIAIAVREASRREVAVAMTGGTAVLFVVVGFAVSVGSMERGHQYSTDEILVLADVAEQNRQYETAIERLEELQRRISSSDAQSAIIARIEKIEAAQSGS